MNKNKYELPIYFKFYDVSEPNQTYYANYTFYYLVGSALIVVTWTRADGSTMGSAYDEEDVLSRVNNGKWVIVDRL